MAPLREALQDLSDDAFFDLLESEGAYLLVLDVPGASAETLEVTVDDGHISVEARREKPDGEGYRYVTEDRPLYHDVDLPLPADATESGAEAVVERGVLELTLPKRTATDETNIDVVEGENRDEDDIVESRDRDEDDDDEPAGGG
ncbi:Hsp20/alpha crystallin family protein [Halobacteria archaeon AArc-dxtr1]|nr:Hsp20/alpha crystallin family protein [Halobacteria archaeon AArc-dxtr1]